MLLTMTIDNYHNKLGITIRLTSTGMIQLSEMSPYCCSVTVAMKKKTIVNLLKFLNLKIFTISNSILAVRPKHISPDFKFQTFNENFFTHSSKKHYFFFYPYPEDGSFPLEGFFGSIWPMK